MRLESALFASREGINAHGQAIAVVGDNIANANTTGYKTARSQFADMMAEAAGDRNSEVTSGAGDGVALARVQVVHEGGLVEQTGRELDVAISGGGFFMVGDAAAPQFTRAGAFQINKDGILVNGNGQPVLGYSGVDTATLGPINMYEVETAGAATSRMQVYGNLDASAGIGAPPQGALTFKELNQAAAFTTTQTVYDSLGVSHDIQLSFFKTEFNTWTVQAHVDGKETGGTPGQPVLLGQTQLNFDGAGGLSDAAKAAAVINANAAWGNGANAGAFTIDLSTFTQYAGGSQIANFTQDGQGAGDIESYEFAVDGKIYAVLNTGERAQIGSIPLATFNNLDGLNRSGSSTFSKTEQAGETLIGAANNGARGKLSGKSLERSTVDIAQQFVELVIFQRGYEANSQALTAANELLKGTIGMLR